jgi:hypothetical protein
LVEPNSAWRYTVTVLDGVPISVEKELDEALALKLANWQPHMSC